MEPVSYMVVVAGADGREIVLAGPVESAWDAEVVAISVMQDRGFTTATLLSSTDGQRTWDDVRPITAPRRGTHGRVSEGHTEEGIPNQ